MLKIERPRHLMLDAAEKVVAVLDPLHDADIPLHMMLSL